MLAHPAASQDPPVPGAAARQCRAVRTRTRPGAAHGSDTPDRPALRPGRGARESARSLRAPRCWQSHEGGSIHIKGKTHGAEDGAGALLVPGESAEFEAAGSNVDVLHMVVPKPPAAVEDGLPGGPG